MFENVAENRSGLTDVVNRAPGGHAGPKAGSGRGTVGRGNGRLRLRLEFQCPSTCALPSLLDDPKFNGMLITHMCPRTQTAGCHCHPPPPPLAETSSPASLGRPFLDYTPTTCGEAVAPPHCPGPLEMGPVAHHCCFIKVCGACKPLRRRRLGAETPIWCGRAHRCCLGQKAPELGR